MNFLTKGKYEKNICKCQLKLFPLNLIAWLCACCFLTKEDEEEEEKVRRYLNNKLELKSESSGFLNFKRRKLNTFQKNKSTKEKEKKEKKEKKGIYMDVIAIG